MCGAVYAELLGMRNALNAAAEVERRRGCSTPAEVEELAGMNAELEQLDVALADLAELVAPAGPRLL